MKTWWILVWAVGGVGAEEPTAVVHPEVEFEPARTVVWTPVFQAGWDAMNAEMGGVPKRCESPLLNQLDGFQWKAEEVMPDDHWRVWAGEATTEFFEQVDKEAAEFLFEDEGPFQEVVPTRPSGVAFYSLLDAQVDFVKPFYGSRKWPMSFKTGDGEKTKVRFWGVAGEDSGLFRDSVRVLSWRPSQAFHAVELLCRDVGLGNVVLFAPPGPVSFSKACRWVRVWREAWSEDSGAELGSGGDRFLHDDDKLRVPYLKFHSRADFASQLMGDRFYGNAGDPWRITAARQRVDFELDERSARVRAVVEGGMDPFGGPVFVPRDFSFDRPFFVLLWREGAEWPYFAAWVGDTNGMKEWEGE